MDLIKVMKQSKPVEWVAGVVVSVPPCVVIDGVKETIYEKDSTVEAQMLLALLDMWFNESYSLRPQEQWDAMTPELRYRLIEADIRHLLSKKNRLGSTMSEEEWEIVLGSAEVVLSK